MMKTILITGSTDGIGLESAKTLIEQGHRVLLHGRNPQRLQAAQQQLGGDGVVEGYLADLSDLKQVVSMAEVIAQQHEHLDVLINNAGVLKTDQPIAESGLDVRFVVNTLAPYLLTQQLLPLMEPTSRVINLSSAAQAPVNLDALRGVVQIDDAMSVYSQSKLAITCWSRWLAQQPGSPVSVAINPGSLLATKMVREGFGIPGHDVRIGADILIRAALSEEFADRSGDYYDNDSHQFADPHPDVLDEQKSQQLVEAIEILLQRDSEKTQ